MTNLLTPNFKTHIAKQFIDSFSEAANTIYFLGAHRSLPFTNDYLPPDPINTIYNINYELYNELIFGKHITPLDVKYMVNNYPWVYGTVYDIYDDQDVNLASKKFFVVSQETSGEYSVFKCLYNNNGKPSYSQPLKSQVQPSDEVFITGDQYHWKYLFTVSASDYNKFATIDYIPFTEDANVTSNAISGAISTILVTSPGTNYNSYATGTIVESAVNGDPTVYRLNSDRYTSFSLVVSNTSGFIIEQVSSINTDNSLAEGVIVSINANTNTIVLTNTINTFNAGQTLTGTTSGANTSIVSATRLTTPLSSNAQFYQNNTFYIRSGTGAGQQKIITDYIVTGDVREVVLDSALTVIPDSTSIYEIGPRVLIIGDGQYANAIATVDPSSNSITSIEVVNSGINYTYADITIIANTGLITSGNTFITANTATARAIISPPGGHGSNVVNELYANKIGIGAEFITSESNTIPTTNDYRKLSLIKDPLFANTNLTLSTSVASNFTAGETVIQANSGATGVVSGRSGDILSLTDIRGFFTTNSTITGVTSSANASVSSIDRSFETFDQRQIFQATLLYSGPQGTGFLQDEQVIQPGFIEYIPTGYVHEIISSNASSNSVVIALTDVQSVFSLSDTVSGTINTIVGQKSGAIAELTGRDYTRNSLVNDSGEIIYVETFSPITRTSTQSEKVKLIIEF